MDHTEAEADIYSVFDKIMKVQTGFFLHGGDWEVSEVEMAEQMKLMGVKMNAKTTKEQAAKNKTPISVLSDKIMNEYLARLDPDLFLFLSEKQIEIGIFLM